ncbi:MAG TPA: radical SAM protein [Verrucomicrobiota bacterium]|nr:radical SAM protein [Verrucomicrobiota bacterium]HNU52059.1 radical SAM protein [Verrucomicrobiota bacterium]
MNNTQGAPADRRVGRFVFGPVPSRRLGRSLGVDLVPFKTCTYDCIYCQCGRTTRKTVERREWVPTEAVLEELECKLDTRPDYITLSGSGEPTLHSALGRIIRQIRSMTRIPVAVLTNGSLLWQKEVRDELAAADLVLPSLDAPDAEQFARINRPHPEITFDRLVEGLDRLRREFPGQYWLEVMLLGGVTTLRARARQFARWTRRIRPDKVQLNTAVRPPAEEYAMAVPAGRLAALAGLFEPRAEVIADYTRRGPAVPALPSGPGVLTLLERRPCTVEDVARGLRVKVVEAVKLLAELEVRGDVRKVWRGGRLFYLSVRSAPGRARLAGDED